MTTPDANNSIRQSVLEKIKSGSVRRIPRAYFVFRIVATILVSLLLLLTSAFIVSFILFSFHETGEQFLLGYGWQGIETFFILFPWGMLALTLVLIFVLEWLLQGFKFGYRVPLLNIFAAILGISIVAGVLISMTPIHGLLLQRADKDQLPIVGSAYEHIFDHHEDQGVCHGIVTAVNQVGFVMEHNDQDHDEDDGQFVVTPLPGSTFPPVMPGDRVLVFGRPQEGIIQAHDVQVLPPIFPDQHHH